MSHIAVIIDDMFEDSEYTEPVNAYQKAVHRITRIGMSKGNTVRGKKENTPVVQDIKNAGALFLDQEVVEDGNLISSRHPGDLPAFIRASLNKLESVG